MEKKSYVSIIQRMCFGAVVLALSGCSPIIEKPENPVTKKKEDAVILVEKTEVTSPGIPRIDIATPGKTETASFGLG